MDIQKDLDIIRELAKKYMEIAQSDKHVRMRKRFKDSNDLKIVRPPVIIEEIPWHEMNYNGELDCKCEDKELRGIEYSLRVSLFREKYFKCDNYIEPVWTVYKFMSSTGNGFEINEERLAVDKNNGIVSHHYNDVLEDESSLEMYHDPVITAYPEEQKRHVQHMEEIFDGILPVKLHGIGSIYYSPWDAIAMLRGAEPILMDMYDRPEYLHRIIGLFTRSQKITLDQMEKLDLFELGCISLHCTPGMVTMPEDGSEHTGCKGIWFRTMAQMFSTISPDAHDEFDLQYSQPLADRCAYTYYGCCEPLDDRIDKLKKRYKNLRKIGCSPWADVEKTAEQTGPDYVLSRKPNPANVASATDTEVVSKEIEETVKAALKYGCPCDITLKDISTVGYKPENLMIWANTVSDVLDAYYGEA